MVVNLQGEDLATGREGRGGEGRSFKGERSVMRME